MPFGIGIWELVILMVVLLLIFGAKRLPEMGRSIGHGMREFKDAVTGKEDEVPKTELTPPPTNTTSATTGPTEPAAEPSETERVSS
jgi:TatA/E family protein of Tat protein translocase